MFLQLFVKVSEKWREKEEFLNELDWRKSSPAAAESTGADESGNAGSEESGNKHNGG